MRFRFGLLLGFGIGYTLGARAGRERYDQICQLWASMSGSQPARQLSAEVRDVANRASEVIEQKAAEGMARVSDLVQRGGGANGGRASSERPTVNPQGPVGPGTPTPPG